MQKMIKTYEEHNLKIPELEKKLRNQKAKYDKDIKELESFYKEKLKLKEKKISNLEDKLKSTILETSKLDRSNDEELDRVNVEYFSNNSIITFLVGMEIQIIL